MYQPTSPIATKFTSDFGDRETTCIGDEYATPFGSLINCREEFLFNLHTLDYRFYHNVRSNRNDIRVDSVCQIQKT